MTAPTSRRMRTARACLIDPRRPASNDVDPHPPPDLALALQSLPYTQRSVLRLRHAAGCGDEDIAAVLDLPVADVARLQREAGAALRGIVAR